MTKEVRTEDPSTGLARRDWPKWLGIAALALGAAGPFGWLVWRADQGVARALDTFLLTVLGLVASVYASVLVGRWSAQQSIHTNFRPFLRAAFRSHGELILGLDRLANQVGKALEKVADRVPFTATEALVLEQSQKALEGLENWRELLPEGVKELEAKLGDRTRKEKEVTTAISEVSKATTAISEIRELAPFSRELTRVLEQLTRERDRLAQSSPFAVELPLTGEPRRLLLAGAYEEAIGAYSRLIVREPKSHTLYMARARAKYLAGDKTGALADLDEAEKLQPADPQASRTRELIQADKPLSPVSQELPVPQSIKEAFRGNSLLAEGDGDGALDAYQRAERAGLRPVNVWQNFAMAHLVKGRTQPARESLANINEDLLGPYVKVQQYALLALCKVLEGNDHAQEIKKLTEAKAGCPHFKLENSPLRFLEMGLGRCAPNKPFGDVFDLIRKKPPPNTP